GAGGFLLLKADRLDQIDEDLSTPIRSEDFGALHLNFRVIDAKSAQGGKQVLHHVNARFCSRKTRAARSFSDISQFRWNLRLSWQIDPLKNDPIIFWSRKDSDRNLFSGKKADARGKNSFLNCVLHFGRL